MSTRPYTPIYLRTTTVFIQQNTTTVVFRDYPSDLLDSTGLSRWDPVRTLGSGKAVVKRQPTQNSGTTTYTAYRYNQQHDDPCFACGYICSCSFETELIHFMVAYYRYHYFNRRSRQNSLQRNISRRKSTAAAALFITTACGLILIVVEAARRRQGGGILFFYTNDSAQHSAAAAAAAATAQSLSNTIMSSNNHNDNNNRIMILQDWEAPLPAQTAGTIRCVVLSDTHGRHWDVDPLPAGDVLIHLGDVANHGSIQHIRSFVDYIKQRKYQDEFRDIVLLEGNHDRDLSSPEKIDLAKEYQEIGTLLVDQVVHVADGRLSILGVSWGACERNDFSKAEQQQQQLASQQGKQIDMLLTHCPPKLLQGKRQLSSAIGAPVHLFGHIHRQRGVVAHKNDGCLLINCSSIPAYRPVVIDWDPKTRRVVMVKF